MSLPTGRYPTLQLTPQKKKADTIALLVEQLMLDAADLPHLLPWAVVFPPPASFSTSSMMIIRATPPAVPTIAGR